MCRGFRRSAMYPIAMCRQMPFERAQRIGVSVCSLPFRPHAANDRFAHVMVYHAHGLDFGIASVTSMLRSMPPASNPSRTQSSASLHCS